MPSAATIVWGPTRTTSPTAAPPSVAAAACRHCTSQARRFHHLRATAVGDGGWPQRSRRWSRRRKRSHSRRRRRRRPEEGTPSEGHLRPLLRLQRPEAYGGWSESSLVLRQEERELQPRPSVSYIPILDAHPVDPDTPPGQLGQEWDEVRAAAVDVQPRAVDLLDHHAALDVPAGTAVAPRGGPARLARLGRLPQREIVAVALYPWTVGGSNPSYQTIRPRVPRQGLTAQEKQRTALSIQGDTAY